MEDMSVSEIMHAIPEYFNPKMAKGVTATVQCVFTGDQGSNWIIRIVDQTCSVNEGLADDPDLTIKADARIGADVLMGKTDPMRAYLFGKIKIKGDLAFGMKLAKLFS